MQRAFLAVRRFRQPSVSTPSVCGAYSRNMEANRIQPSRANFGFCRVYLDPLPIAGSMILSHPTQRTYDWWDSPRFRAFFWLRVFSAPKQSPRPPTVHERKLLSGFVQNTGRWGFCGTYGKHFAHAWLRVFSAPKQSPRPPTVHERKPLAWLRVFFCFQAESTPAHCPRTQTVSLLSTLP